MRPRVVDFISSPVDRNDLDKTPKFKDCLEVSLKPPWPGII